MKLKHWSSLVFVGVYLGFMAMAYMHDKANCLETGGKWNVGHCIRP